MSIEKRVDEILNNLSSTGSKIEYLQNLKKESIGYLQKDINLTDILDEIARKIQEETQSFLDKKNPYDVNFISGISACIYLPDFDNNGEYKLKLIGGSRNRSTDLPVDENTMFDVASITKLYTLIFLFELEEAGVIHLNDKVSDINPNFKDLEDFTFNDLIRLCGELRTKGNVAQAKSQQEAYNLLKTLFLQSNNREENKYTDFGAIVISDTIEQIFTNYYGKKMTFDEIMNKFFFEKLGLNHTTFRPQTENLSGNGNNFKQVHDPKARILGGAVGSAGIFVTSDDLARLAKEIYSVNYVQSGYFAKKENRLKLSPTQLKRLGEITFPNSAQSQKGNLGIYVKHPAGFDKTYVPPEFSDGSFAHQGWTGSVATFDPNNLIHNNILVNSIYNSDNKDTIKNDKPVGFGIAFDEYLEQITKESMLIYVVKKYYNKYCNVKEDIDVTVTIQKK